MGGFPDTFPSRIGAWVDDLAVAEFANHVATGNSLEVTGYSLGGHLAQVFTIARGSRTEAQVITVRISREGVSGWGECVPYARYGETMALYNDITD